MLTFYGFCIDDNKHDSVVMRIYRKLPSDARLSVEGIVEALVLSPEQVVEGYRKEIEDQRKEALGEVGSDTIEYKLTENTKGI